MGKTLYEGLVRYRTTIFDIASWVILGLLLMLLAKWVLIIAMPIVIGVGIHLLMKPLTRILIRWRVGPKFATLLALSMVLIIVFGVGGVLLLLFAQQTVAFFSNIPQYYDGVSMWVSENHALFSELPYGLSDKVMGFTEETLIWVAQAVPGMFWTVTNYLTSSVGLFVNILLGIILAYMLGLESVHIERVVRQISPNWLKQSWLFFSDYVWKGITSYFKAQLKLISITFVVVLVGMLVIGGPNAFTVAVIAASLDFLPLVGMAILFLPWALYLLLTGQTSMAIGLLVVYAIVFVIRQILEPKIVGDSLGVSAFVMLSLMVLFYGFFGFWGMLLTPILTILCKELWVQGFFAKAVRFPRKEEG